MDAIQGILPLRCTFSVPCTERWVLGLGLRDNRVFTVVCPAPKPNLFDTPIDDGKMLLSRHSESDASWALQINQVLGIASCDVDTTQHHVENQWTCPNDWFRPATTRAGDRLVWLDPAAVSNSLLRVGGGR